MYSSEAFGRLFWVDDNYDLKSCPQFNNGTGDFDNEDYVSEWTDWEGVDMNLLFNIYKFELLNKRDYAGSLTHKEAQSTSQKVSNKKEVMNTYDEDLYKEIVKDSQFSYGKFNEHNYPLHLQQL